MARLPFASFVLPLVCITLIWFVCPASTASTTIHVNAGQSIQAAIHAANNGDQILVGPGTYAEQLTVKKDGITLTGQGAILIPPASFTQNKCSGLAGPDTEAGICVVGSDIELAPFVVEHRKVLSVGKPVKHVSVNGFQVHGFSGENIAVLGAQDAHVKGNYLYDGGQYGFLTAGSVSTRVTDNVVGSTTGILPIALCNDDFSDVQVSNNHVSGYFVGLCIQTDGAQMRNNDVSNCCIGGFIDPGVKDAHVVQNRFSMTNAGCDGTTGAGGVFLDGCIDSEVSHNLIEGQHAGGLAPGVAIIDDFTTDPVSVASGNLITENNFQNNDFDIYVNTTGTGNVVIHNLCTSPAALCS